MGKHMKPIARIFRRKVHNTQTEERPYMLAVINIDWETVIEIRLVLSKTQETHHGFSYKWTVIGTNSYACCITIAHSVYIQEEIGSILGHEVKDATAFDFGAWKIKHRLFR